MNPLSNYFRQPIIYIKLPSLGNFYAPGALTMPQNGELPVYAMTAIDEIRYRTPDALFNGQATVDVIQSCIPSIKDAWAVPAIDIDALLTAIRIASYGHNMEFSTECPACKHKEDRALDLRSVLDQLKPADYSIPVVYGDLTINFRPLSYKNMNDNSRMQYDEQRMLSQIPQATDDNVKDLERTYSQALKRITEISVLALAQSIFSIKTPSAIVTEQEYIIDLLNNCDRQLFNQIREHAIKIREQSELKPLSITCTECSHVYEQSITLDMSNFFGPAS